jgi:hypothetical protein
MRELREKQNTTEKAKRAMVGSAKRCARSVCATAAAYHGENLLRLFGGWCIGGDVTGGFAGGFLGESCGLAQPIRQPLSCQSRVPD